jgi:hypothetical protein
MDPINSKRPKKTWTPEEDDHLRQLTLIHGTVNWTAIAEGLEGRTGKQCRERYHNHLQPYIQKKEWTVEEDRQIVELQAQFGNQWAKISKFLPGRSDNAVKNRWHAAMRSVNRISAGSMVLPVSEVSAENQKPIQGRRHPLVPFLSLASGGKPVQSLSSPPCSSSSAGAKNGTPRLKPSPRMNDAPSCSYVSITSSDISSHCYSYGHDSHGHDNCMSNRSEGPTDHSSFLIRAKLAVLSLGSVNEHASDDNLDPERSWRGIEAFPVESELFSTLAFDSSEYHEFEFNFEKEDEFFESNSPSTSDDDDDDGFDDALFHGITGADEDDGNESDDLFHDFTINSGDISDLWNFKNMGRATPKISPRTTPRSPRCDLMKRVRSMVSV